MTDPPGAQVVANEMRHLGENGVVLIGAAEWVDGRAGTQPRRSTVAGNVIHHVGLYTKQSCAVLSAVAVRVISDCHFRKTATEYNRKTGIKWLSCTEK
jgi:hypothetical protein